MKKYLFGVLAIALAVGFSAFTKPAKNLTSTYFELKSAYASADESTDISVASNWQVAGSQAACTSGSSFACKILVDNADLQNFGQELNSSYITITPSQVSSSPNRFVVGSIATSHEGSESPEENNRQ